MTHHRTAPAGWADMLLGRASAPKPDPAAASRSSADAMRIQRLKHLALLPEGFLAFSQLEARGLFGDTPGELRFWKEFAAAVGKALRQPGMTSGGDIVKVQLGAYPKQQTITLFYGGEDSNRIRYALNAQDAAALRTAYRQRTGDVEVKILERTTLSDIAPVRRLSESGRGSR